MYIFLPHGVQRRALRRAWRSGRTLVLSVVLGLTLASGGAAEEPSKGGTILWAVHEGMPDFDIHYQGTYIAAQPIGPIYNGLLTFDVYDNEKIVGDLAERWEISEDGKRITFALDGNIWLGGCDHLWPQCRVASAGALPDAGFAGGSAGSRSSASTHCC